MTATILYLATSYEITSIIKLIDLSRAVYIVSTFISYSKATIEAGFHRYIY